MPSTVAPRRNFNPMSFPGLSDEAREAVNEAFDAMSNWRVETANNSEKNSQQVIKKIAKAAQALGWPEQIVEATQAQMQNITKMQIQTMDRMMDAWEEQIKSPNLQASPSAMLSKLKLPGFGPVGNWPTGVEDFQQAVMNPLQFWLKFTEQWQKAWADAMTSWTKPHAPQR
jgi:hypothetical protein